VKRNVLKPRLDALEALLRPKGKLLVFSTPEDAARIKAAANDIVIVTGVPRPNAGLQAVRA
jgi:hypothetical protein